MYFERDSAPDVYLIRSGEVELTREVAGIAPRRLRAGEMVGLADALGGGLRIETARAVRDTTATAIPVDDLRNMLSSNIQIGLKVITTLCAELREIDEVIVTRMRGHESSAPAMAGDGINMIADHFSKKGMVRAARYAYGRYLEVNPNASDYCDTAIQLGALCEREGDIEIAFDIYSRLRERFASEPRAEAAYRRLEGVMATFRGRL